MRSAQSIQKEVQLDRQAYYGRARRTIIYVVIFGIVLGLPLLLLLSNGIPLGSVRTVQLVNGVPTLVERCRFFTQFGPTLRDKLPARGTEEPHC